MTWDIRNYASTPAGNTVINGINIAEGCNASGINDAIRQLMADLATPKLATLAINGATLGGAVFAVSGASSFAGAVNNTVGGFTDNSGAGFTTTGFGITASYGINAIALSGTNSNFEILTNTGAGVNLPWNSTSWVAVSDETMKTEFTPFVDALNKVSQIKVGTGRYLTDPEGTSRSFLGAHSLKKVLPEAVTLRVSNPDKPSAADGKLMASYTDPVPLLIAALTEAKTRIEVLEARA